MKGTFVRAADQYSRCHSRFGVIIEELASGFIKLETHFGVYTCWGDSATECKNLTPLDESLVARVRARLALEAERPAA